MDRRTGAAAFPAWPGRLAAGLALAAIVAAGFWLRWRTLALDDIWLDEAATLQRAGLPLAALWLGGADPTPPLYYTLQGWLTAPWPGAAEARALSLAAGTLTLPVVFLAGRALGGTAAGLAAAAVLAVQGAHVEYSQEARAYALLVLLAALGALGLARALGPVRDGRGAWLFGLAAALGLMTHHTAAAWAGAGALALLADALAAQGEARRTRLLRLGRIALAVAPAVALWLWLLGVALGAPAGGAGGFQWIGETDAAGLARLLRGVWFLRGIGAGQPWADAALALAALAGGLVALRRPGAAAVIAVFAAVPLLLWLAGAVTPVLLPRTVLAGLLAPVLAWGLLAAALPRAAGLALVLGLVAAQAASTLAHEAAGRTQHTDWRAALGRVAAWQPGIPLLLACPVQAQGLVAYHWPGPLPPWVLSATGAGVPVLIPPPAAPGAAEAVARLARAGRAEPAAQPALLGPFGPERAGAALAEALGAGPVHLVRAGCPDGGAVAAGLAALAAGAGARVRPLWRGRGIAVERVERLPAPPR